MQVTGDWLENPETQRVLALLEGAGHQAYCVGGCVRNALLGAPVADVDIATDARPERVQSLAETAGMKAVPTGIDHGTLTVISNDHPFEITTFRRDVATDGRRATVAFADTIREDALRRDFTVNALYARADGHIEDPLGGLPDIAARRIRFIEDANRRIEEDYLRILRFFRFFAWYGDPQAGPDPEGLAACARHVDGIAQLSKERLGAEMKKLLAAPDPAPAVAAMAACGALAQVLPGADPAPLAPLVHLEQQLDLPPRWQRRLVALGGEKPVRALRLSNAEGRDLSAIRAVLQSDALQPDAGLAVAAYRHGTEAARDGALVRAATLGTPPPDNLLTETARGGAQVFPVSGRDLVERLGSGPELGAELKRLEQRWIDSDFTLRREALLGD